jgi:hypothetical protein
MTTLDLVTAFDERIWNACDFERQVIVELWVLGGLAGLDEVHKNNQLERRSARSG